MRWSNKNKTVISDTNNNNNNNNNIITTKQRTVITTVKKKINLFDISNVYFLNKLLEDTASKNICSKVRSKKLSYMEYSKIVF